MSLRTARIAFVDAACVRTVWWAAAKAERRSKIPGAWIPMPYPSQATTHGSLIGENFLTRSPKRSTTAVE